MAWLILLSERIVEIASLEDNPSSAARTGFVQRLESYAVVKHVRNCPADSHPAGQSRPGPPRGRLGSLLDVGGKAALVELLAGSGDLVGRTLAKAAGGGRDICLR